MGTWSRELADLDPLKEQILARMARIVQHVSGTRAENVAADDMTMWQYKTLLILRKQAPPYEASPSGLADSLGLTRGAMSTRIQQLEDLGWVSRRHIELDRRRVTVTLTDAGHAVVEKHLAAEEHRERGVLAVLSKREQEQLANLLRRVLVAIERSSAKPDRRD